MSKRVVITGAGGLIGWHAAARLHAQNCAAAFKKEPKPFDLVLLDRQTFEADETLQSALKDTDAVLHFAGVNRAPDEEVLAANPSIAKRLADACDLVGANPHIVYANSTHSISDTPYGNSKRLAGEVLDAFAHKYTDLVLPHIFGECAKPFYNNVTATLIHQVLQGEELSVNPEGYVNLLHAGVAAQCAIDAITNNQTGVIAPKPRTMSIPELADTLTQYHHSYQSNIYPDLSDDFDVQLFNSYRSATYPNSWPRPLQLNTDARGTLFEATKSNGGGGQCFLSTTEPGVTRGDHFHLNKVERFLVIQGDAVIRIRKVLDDGVWEYRVSGEKPSPVDMPTLHTHSIENIGKGPLLTLFWTHDLFDPQNPDTFADKVLS